MVFGRRHSYRLFSRLLKEALRWANAIQNVIDGKAPVDTPTQQLLLDVQVREREMMSSGRAEWLTPPFCRRTS